MPEGPLSWGFRIISTKPINMDELTYLASDCVRRFDEARKDSFEDREDLLRKLLMYEVNDSGLITEMEHDYCMVLIFESADSGWLMAEAAGHMREQGPMCWCRGRTSVRLQSLRPPG